MLLYALYCSLSSVQWLRGSMCSAEIVPTRLRTFIYAFDRSFEMAVAACAAPVVGKLAESVFGFDVRLLP